MNTEKWQRRQIVSIDRLLLQDLWRGERVLRFNPPLPADAELTAIAPEWAGVQLQFALCSQEWPAVPPGQRPPAWGGQITLELAPATPATYLTFEQAVTRMLAAERERQRLQMLVLDQSAENQRLREALLPLARCWCRKDADVALANGPLLAHAATEVQLWDADVLRARAALDWVREEG